MRTSDPLDQRPRTQSAVRQHPIESLTPGRKQDRAAILTLDTTPLHPPHHPTQPLNPLTATNPT
jgi:hypothetical protein